MLPDLSNYKIYWDDDSSGYPYSNDIEIGDDTFFVVSNLTSGNKYYFAVTTKDSSGNESWYSNEVSAEIIPPVLDVNSVMDFPETALHDSSIVTLKIISVSSSPLTIDSITGSSNEFYYDISLPILIEGNDTLGFPIVFKPSSFGDFIDTLNIKSDGGDASVIMNGSSPHPVIIVTPSPISFGSVLEDSTMDKYFSIRNSSVNFLRVDSLYTSTDNFKVKEILNSIVTMDDTLRVTISFKPDSVGLFSDTLYIVNNSPTEVLKVAVDGIGTIKTGISELNHDIPTEYMLQQNYPNPFNPITTIRYGIPSSAKVTLKVYDVLGNEVETLVSEEKSAGYYEVEFDGINISSGIYFYRIQAGNFNSTKKFILMK